MTDSIGPPSRHGCPTALRRSSHSPAGVGFRSRQRLVGKIDWVVTTPAWISSRRKDQPRTRPPTSVAYPTPTTPQHTVPDYTWCQWQYTGTWYSGFRQPRTASCVVSVVPSGGRSIATRRIDSLLAGRCLTSQPGDQDRSHSSSAPCETRIAYNQDTGFDRIRAWDPSRQLLRTVKSEQGAPIYYIRSRVKGRYISASEVRGCSSLRRGSCRRLQRELGQRPSSSRPLHLRHTAESSL